MRAAATTNAFHHARSLGPAVTTGRHILEKGQAKLPDLFIDPGMPHLIGGHRQLCGFGCSMPHLEQAVGLCHSWKVADTRAR